MLLSILSRPNKNNKEISSLYRLREKKSYCSRVPDFTSVRHRGSTKSLVVQRHDVKLPFYFSPPPSQYGRKNMSDVSPVLCVGLTPIPGASELPYYFSV